MAQSPIMAAIQQICQEKNLSVESVIETIEAALAAAYRKDFGQKNQNIKVEYDPETGTARIFDVKIVVEDELKEKAEKEAAERKAAIERGEEPPSRFESLRPDSGLAEKQAVAPGQTAKEEDDEEEEELRYNPKLHISLTDAKEIKEDAKLEEEIRVELQQPEGYGRMAAQTAKQVIIQRLREAERATIYEEYKDKEGTVIMGTVQRREGPNVLMDFGRAVGILPLEEQISRERYNIGSRFKVYILSVEMGNKGSEIILSRRNQEIVRELFTIEIPEIANGLIEIKAIAREAGFRSKVAVYTDEENIDPIGSCVGQRGARVQTIISELGGEKIDIIEWSEDDNVFITNAMLPAKILNVDVDKEKQEVTVSVDTEQSSLAIGKNGQNVRLASQLTGYTISIIEVKDDKKREITQEEIERGEESKNQEIKKAKNQEEEVEEKDKIEEKAGPEKPDGIGAGKKKKVEKKEKKTKEDNKEKKEEK